jgi:TetR/AcrR family transcriptional regulator, ethionamide resistance regulator
MTSGPATFRRRANARVRREEARERIVAAAEKLILTVPYRDLTVDLVMAQAGLSRTVFYRHFDGLPEVLLTLLSRIEADLAAPVETGDLRDVLAASVNTFARYGPFLRALDHAAGYDAGIEAAFSALVDRFTEEIADSLGDGRRGYELARALNLMNGHYMLDTLGKDPGFDRDLALDTLVTIWEAVASAAVAQRPSTA